jgi:dephospho-CoA kinase
MGAGKSTALAALEDLGAATLSTDRVVHELYGDDEVRDLVVARWGEDVAPGGTVDRAKVGERVFADPGEREWLEQLLWPRVGARVAAWRKAQSDREPPPRALVVETPLLFEAGMDAFYDATIAVTASDAVREARTGERTHVSAAERNARQLPQEEKAERATFAVVNDGSPEELRQELSGVLAKLRR